jgi:hypothetical protein
MSPAQYVPLQFQPGIWKNGTLYQAQNRWYDADLMRWSVGALGPIGGWRAWGDSTTAVTGVPRTALTWTDNSNNRWLAAGSASKLYVYDSSATRFDITPAGFTSGSTDADPNTGYGDWLYGKSSYGTVRPDLGVPSPATIWALDLWGEDLVGCTPDDGKIYVWDTSVGTGTVAAQLANSPTLVISTAVTPERIQMAFGGRFSTDAQDRRTVYWSDSEDNTDWTASATNQAGNHTFDSKGDLLGAVKVRGKMLIFTTDDAHAATYVGLPYVYSFDRVGDNCGPVSVNAVAVAGNTAYWMGRSANGFFQYDGYVRSIPCDVEDYIITQMNQAQSSKVVAWHNALFSEVVWFYPGTGTEVDAYISYNYEEQHWSVGTLARTAVTSRGVFAQPILFDSSGNPYEHEVGGVYKDTGASALVPYVESGPIQLGGGDRVLSATSLIPDVTALGDITTTFYTRLYPTDSDTTHGPYTMAAPTSVRFTGRTVRMKCTSDSANAWRVGIPRLEMQPGGRR